MRFNRELLIPLKNSIQAQKVTLILGARRVGKSELIKDFLKDRNDDYLLLNGDDVLDIQLLEERSISNYSRLLAGKKLLIIDEAQNISNIGQKLKLMVDNLEGLAIIITGSSALELNQKAGEPLVGRMKILQMFPLSYREISQEFDFKQIQQSLEHRLIYGSYPEVLTLNEPKEQATYLGELVGSLLLKDILAYGDVRKSDKIFDLLRLIAYQMGSEVNYSELGKSLQISKNTVEKYIDLLIQSFILIRVGGYSGNLRKEVTKQPKLFFLDNGIRNAILNNFSPLNVRGDLGALWENYCIQERIKRLNYDQIRFQGYFWRTYDSQEIDWIEDYDQSLHAFEMKYTKTANLPGAFAKNYPTASFNVMNKDNYFEFIE